VFSSIVGVYFSYVYDVATGASIVLVASVLFATAFLLSPKQGVFIRWFRAYLSKKI
jgi:iron/zinc/copper transport system permease protein